MTVVCHTCGHQNPDGSPSCQYCGRSLEPASIPHHARPAQAVEASSQPQDQGGYAQPGQGGGYGPNPDRQQHYRGQYGMPPARPYAVQLIAVKDPGTGLLLEILPGLFGFLGIGWLWAGETGIGIALLLGYWVFLFSEGLFIVFSFGLLLFCCAPLNLAVLLASGFLLQKRLRDRQALAMGVQPF